MISEGKSKPACILSMRKDFLQSIRVLKLWLRPFVARASGATAPAGKGRLFTDRLLQACPSLLTFYFLLLDPQRPAGRSHRRRRPATLKSRGLRWLLPEKIAALATQPVAPLLAKG